MPCIILAAILFKSQLYRIIKQEFKPICILIVNGVTESSLNLLG